MEVINIITALIVAGGKGKRLGLGVNKQFVKVGNKEILARTLEVFQNSKYIDEIIVVCAEDEIEYCRENIVQKYKLHKVIKLVSGGVERHNSVKNGLDSCNLATTVVVIHDGARPFVTDEIIRKSVEAVLEYGACTVAVPVKDTIKRVGADMFSIDTLKREELYSIQTPQSFKYELIMAAHKNLEGLNIKPTDDTMLVELLGTKVKIIEGSNTNIKITTKEDLLFAEAILKNS